ncbi:MAG: LicD family protein, partial [Butyrivibrio sp.]|nr:LicD family protein [Butyrivibrio sp.]
MDHKDRVSIENISFEGAFFEDEVREGFFVSTMMKRYWAAQLKVLSVIACICKKHGIGWFADYGTLMGAVRHGGYIPWDDDLDICMLRSDYDRFFEIAASELPKEYVIMTLKTQNEFREQIGRIANSHSIDYSPEHLEEFYGCPYTVGVDIFPVDGLYNDPDKENERKERAKKALEAYGKTGAREDLLRIDS